MSGRTVVAVSCLALLSGVAPPAAHAQSALDGFNPGANALGVIDIALEPDGKIVAVGGFTTLGGGGTGTAPRNRIGRLLADGTLDSSFNPGANGNVNVVVLQPDGKILVGGEFTMLGGGGTGTTQRNRIGRLNADGSLDSGFNPGANGSVYTLELQPDGKILVAGFFTGLGSGAGTTPRSNIGRLNPDGSVDATFNPGANSSIGALALQPDGKILVGGAFTLLGGGGTGTTPRNRIGRLNADGSLDASFNPGASGSVFELAVQPDGKILATGFFTGLGGGTGSTVRNRIGRLNADGSIDAGFNPGANGNVGALAIQADGKILVGGYFTGLGGGTGTTPRRNVGRLNADGSVDATFDPGTTGLGDVFALVEQADGKILIGGYFTGLGGSTGTTPRSMIGRLHADGTIDADLNPGANEWVSTLAVQPDGKIVAGGAFTALGGGSGLTPRSYIGRLNPDGTLDAAFNPGANSYVLTTVVQPDGKILVGGVFTALGGGTGTTPRGYIGRLNPDGSLDQDFNPGTNGQVNVIALEPDGQILVGGDFTMLAGSPHSRIGRLNPDGSIDASFNPGASGGSLGGAVWALLVEPDGQILVGGDFTLLDGSSRSNIGRLNADGSLDAVFNPGANAFVQSLALQPDGKVVVGGSFTALGGGGTGTTPRRSIGRVNPDGSIDASFDPGANSDVLALAAQADRSILVAGSFTMLGGGGTGTTPRNRIGRLNPDGTVDATFDPGANALVLTVTLQPDGKILAGGPFTTLGGGGTGTASRLRIGRLSQATAAIQRLSASCAGCVPTISGAVPANLTWMRSGAAPEVQRVTFEISTDGVTYTPAATATRIAGGWHEPLTVPGNTNLLVRARGYYASGFNNKAGSIAESIRRLYISCPIIAETSVPAGATGYPYAATFSAPGAIGVVTFFVTGMLPAGLMMSSGGTLSGTPTQAGTFPLTVTATDLSSGCIDTQDVTLSIALLPTLTLDRTSLRFGAVTTGAAFVSQTSAQVVRLRQSGAGTVTWTAVPSQPWIQVTPAFGTGSADLSIGVVFMPGLPVGSPVAGTITFMVAGLPMSPVSITISLNLIPNGLSAPPFGVVDTPLESSTGITGSVPFTGWALDDVETTRVVVCRGLVSGEVGTSDPNCGAALIFVGTAVFIEGARPDVAAAYPAYPANTNAGWGLMVLTNMLPNQGNGTYLFAMFAEDRDGHRTLLGVRTITCANASATKPFGAIDTPTQGGGVSGSSFVNFGWALTPQPKMIPVDGSTITVWVDGVPLGTVDYNHERADIETLFPAYQNTVGSNGAVGFRIIDTTTLMNGLHTISWTVVDDAGASEGIGSRFFTVSNAPGGLTATAESKVVRASEAAAVRTIDLAPLDTAVVAGRRGWDLSAPLETFAPNGSGRMVVRSEEVSRIELRLGEAQGARYSGYLRMGEGLAPLPIGSQLDRTTGVFTWAPGVGFVGAYDVVFVRWLGAHAAARQEVRIVLAPKGSGRVGPQVVIDAPRAQQDVAQPFVVGGWAADLRASSGTGIATVHVWGYPLAGGPPVFLGAAAYGGARPDVAAVQGDSFRDVGFGLVVQGLPHGDYDLAVFAWSTETADFVPAKVVRVTVR